MSSRQVWFYTKRLVNCVHYIFRFRFLCSCCWILLGTVLAIDKFKQLLFYSLVFCRILTDKSLRVYRTLLSILADLNNVVVWMVLILLLISISPSLPSKPLGTVPSAPTAVDIAVTLKFYPVFSALKRSKYLSIFSVLCQYHSVVG